jgi:methylated-DNA-protein-cysteine methyltransferase-like protein
VARGAVSDSYQRIYSVVRRIPHGRVATYGQVAALAGLPRQPRLVGYAMHALPNGTAVPWHRVINAQGRVSPRSGDGGGSVTQRVLLEAEGVRFDAAGRVSLARQGWTPRRSGRTVTPRARGGAA